METVIFITEKNLLFTYTPTDPFGEMTTPLAMFTGVVQYQDAESGWLPPLTFSGENMGIFDFFKKIFSGANAKPAPGAASPKPIRTNVSYNRIHSWVESRIGKLSDMPRPEQEEKLYELLNNEKANKDPDLGYDPQAGLEAYIKTNSYRKMLE